MKFNVLMERVGSKSVRARQILPAGRRAFAGWSR